MRTISTLVQDAGANQVVKSGLLPTTRPSEPENKTDVDECIGRLRADDPTLTEINLNNMKVALLVLFS